MRKSNEVKANELAAQRGITITTDHNDRGGIIRISLDGPYMKLRGYSCTATLGYSGNTVPQLWATIVRELETIPTEDTCHTCGTIVPTTYINHDGCDYCQCPTCERCQLPEPRCECPDEDETSELDVWVCECCALMVNNSDESSCRDFHGHTHPTCDKSVTHANTEDTFKVGCFHANCNGCGKIVRTGGTLYAAIRQAN